jgi:hypothetical protein
MRTCVRSMALTRKCSRCGEVKPVDDFAWRRKEKGQRDSFCRPCRSAYGKEHYEANRQRYIEQAAVLKRVRMLERTRYLIDFFATHPCLDCGETDPVVLEFDHLRDKAFAIGPALAEKLEHHSRRDREVRGGVRELPSQAHRSPTRSASGRSHGDYGIERAAGIEPVSESLEGSCATFTPRPRTCLRGPNLADDPTPPTPRSWGRGSRS